VTVYKLGFLEHYNWKVAVRVRGGGRGIFYQYGMENGVFSTKKTYVT
jgi:hypothetical protein